MIKVREVMVDGKKLEAKSKESIEVSSSNKDTKELGCKRPHCSVEGNTLF